MLIQNNTAAAVQTPTSIAKRYLAETSVIIESTMDAMQLAQSVQLTFQDREFEGSYNKFDSRIEQLRIFSWKVEENAYDESEPLFVEKVTRNYTLSAEMEFVSDLDPQAIRLSLSFSFVSGNGSQTVREEKFDDQNLIVDYGETFLTEITL